MDAFNPDILVLTILDENISAAWRMVDDELRLDVVGGDGMMHASARVDDGTVFITEFDGWEITAEYRLSGSAHIMGPRAVAILDAIAEEHA